jgi:hypothetical protein
MADFESYATRKRAAFPYYTCFSKTENSTYHLIGNQGGSLLFSNYPDINFWFLVRFEDGLNERRLSSLKKKLHNELSQLEQVFLVVQADPKKMADYDCFSDDFSLYHTQLLNERLAEEKKEKEKLKKLRQDKRLR